jgi:hypothetical protein
MDTAVSVISARVRKGVDCTCEKGVIRQQGKPKYQEPKEWPEIGFIPAEYRVFEYDRCKACKKKQYKIVYVPMNEGIFHHIVWTEDPAFWVDASFEKPNRYGKGRIVGEYTIKSNKPADIAGPYVLMIEQEIAKQMMSLA